MSDGQQSNSTKKSGKISYFLSFCFALFLSLGLQSFVEAYIFDAKMKNATEIETDEQIEIGFNQPVISMDLNSVMISPYVGFSYELSEDRRNLVIKPTQNFSNDQKYKITLNNIRGLSGLTIYNKEFIFYTVSSGAKPEILLGIQTVNAAEEFSSLSLSRDRYVPPESSQVKKENNVVPYITDGKYIDVSISNQIMTLFENGTKINEFLVSTGKYGMPTPLGEFKVLRKETNHWSYKYKLWMPYSMNFSGPYYIHELPYWPNGYHEGENHLGRRVSHGCIRLGIGPAKYVFNWAEIGTPIYIHQ